MAVNEGLAQRVTELLADNPYTTQKQMLGGMGLMISGNMCVGIMGNSMVVRADPQGLAEDEDLEHWLKKGERFASALMPKG